MNNNGEMNPGAPGAKTLGCKCPSVNNCKGKGFTIKIGHQGSGSSNPMGERALGFIVIQGCPVHWPADRVWKTEKAEDAET